jgi:hypothetical protein
LGWTPISTLEDDLPVATATDKFLGNAKIDAIAAGPAPTIKISYI